MIQKTEVPTLATAKASEPLRTEGLTAPQSRGHQRDFSTYAIAGMSSSRLLSNSGMSLWKKV